MASRTWAMLQEFQTPTVAVSKVMWGPPAPHEWVTIHASALHRPQWLQLGIPPFARCFGRHSVIGPTHPCISLALTRSLLLLHGPRSRCPPVSQGSSGCPVSWWCCCADTCCALGAVLWTVRHSPAPHQGADIPHIHSSVTGAVQCGTAVCLSKSTFTFRCDTTPHPCVHPCNAAKVVLVATACADMLAQV